VSSAIPTATLAVSKRGLGFSWLDVKLALRMLLRQPGLTLVAVFALSIGIPASLLPMHIFAALVAPLPFDEADRIVGLENRDIAEGGTQVRALHDFYLWREKLTSLSALGAARSDPYNVISSDGRAAPIRGAQVTASTFDIVRVAPFAGRALLPSDEVPGAPDVVVIGYDVWQSRLAGDPNAVGSTIRIGEVPHEVVGIMPEGFLFPINDHLWLPLRQQPTDYERGMGPDIYMFGRLADGVTLAQAQAELSTIGASMSTQFPSTHEHLRPQVLGYTSMLTGGDPGDRLIIYLIQLVVFALLAIVCGNVGILILARTATRSGEIAMRTALGASRSRIVSQLFVESLMLALLSAGFGLVLGEVVANVFQNSGILEEAPFWLDFGVTFRTAATALAIAAFCAVIAGVLPALKATGARVQRNLQRHGTGSGIRFGIGATVLIVAEVALAVGFLTVGGLFARSLITAASTEMEIEPAEYAMAMVRIPWTDHNALENDLRVPEFRSQVVFAHEELLRRLGAAPGVRGVAMGTALPGMGHAGRRLEIEAEDLPEGSEGHEVRWARVDVGFFRGLGAQIQNGRDFSTSDLTGTPVSSRPSAIVNTAFVEYLLGGGNPIGRHFRYLNAPGQPPSEWYEIVGVVGHLGMNDLNSVRDEGVYHPAAPGELHPIWMAVHVGENPVSFLPRLREITTGVDPDAMIQSPASLADAPNGNRSLNAYALLLMAVLAGVAVVLSSAGLYALMSFTVSQRTKEIGIRTALGARPSRIVLAVAKRAFLQLLVGVLMGAGVGLWLLSQVEGEDNLNGANLPLMMLAVSTLVLVVGMLACLSPTLRGLRIRPVDALKNG
jgi:putative ABC transport system permease protein